MEKNVTKAIIKLRGDILLTSIISELETLHSNLLHISLAIDNIITTHDKVEFLIYTINISMESIESLVIEILKQVEGLNGK